MPLRTRCTLRLLRRLPAVFLRTRLSHQLSLWLHRTDHVEVPAQPGGGRYAQKLNLSGLVSPADLQAKINAGFDRLNDLKHDDGGWGWWKEDASSVFMTAYVVSGLAEAKSAGYAKADANLGGGVAYLQKQLAQHPRMLPSCAPM